MRISPPRVRRALISASIGLALLVTPGFASAQDALGSSPQILATSQELGGQVFDLTNDARLKHDRRALKLNDRISAYALRHSKRMAEDYKRLVHTRKLARPLRSVSWRYAGENIGFCTVPTGQSSCLSVLQNAFMSSAGHRRNILDRRFDHVATGVYEKAGKQWVTVIFYG